MSILDLPDDMIRYELMPLLDWESRINLNIVMPPDYRVSTKLKKDMIVMHEMHAISTIIEQKITKCSIEPDPSKKAIILSENLNFYLEGRGKHFIENFESFRKCVVEKAETYLDHTVSIGEGADEYYAIILSLSCANVYEMWKDYKSTPNNGVLIKPICVV